MGHNSNEAGFYKIGAYAQGNIFNDSQWDDFNRKTFFCPSNKAAADRSRYQTPSWRFRYNADWENTRLYPGSDAYHGVDMHMIYGESADITGLPDFDAQRELRHKMRRLWGAFLKDP